MHHLLEKCFRDRLGIHRDLIIIYAKISDRVNICVEVLTFQVGSNVLADCRHAFRMRVRADTADRSEQRAGSLDCVGRIYLMDGFVI